MFLVLFNLLLEFNLRETAHKTSCSDTMAPSIPNGQKQHFPMLSYAWKTMFDTDVGVTLYVSWNQK